MFAAVSDETPHLWDNLAIWDSAGFCGRVPTKAMDASGLPSFDRCLRLPFIT